MPSEPRKTFSRIIATHIRTVLRSVNFETVFWGGRFPPRNDQKQVNLRYHSSKVEFVRSFFGGN